jgi:hypothetical protein
VQDDALVEGEFAGRRDEVVADGRDRGHGCLADTSPPPRNANVRSVDCRSDGLDNKAVLAIVR